MPHKISQEVRMACAVGFGMILGHVKNIKNVSAESKKTIYAATLFLHIRQLIHDLVSKEHVFVFIEQEAMLFSCPENKDHTQRVSELLRLLAENTERRMDAIENFFKGCIAKNNDQNLHTLEIAEIKPFLLFIFECLCVMERYLKHNWHAQVLKQFIDTTVVYGPDFIKEILQPMLVLYREGGIFAPMRLPFNLEPDTKKLIISLDKIDTSRNVLFTQIEEKISDVTELQHLYIQGALFNNKHYHVITTILDTLRGAHIAQLALTFQVTQKPPQGKKLTTVAQEMLSSLVARLFSYNNADVRKVCYDDAMPFPELQTSASRGMIYKFILQKRAQDHALLYRLPPAQFTSPLEDTNQDLNEIPPPKRQKTYTPTS